MAKHALPSRGWELWWAWWVPGLLLAGGAALRIRQWLHGRSLWLDEAFVAGDITERGYLELLEPLDNGQVAPAGWLWAARASVLVGGESELALRFPALLAGIALLGAGWWVGRMLLTPTRAWVVVGVLALSPALVRYSDEVKPYALDALWAAGMLGACLAAGRASTRRACLGFALIASLAALSSHGATFAVASATLALVLAPGGEARGGERLARRLWFALGGCLAGVVWAGVHAQHLGGNAQAGSLRSFWAVGFPPSSEPSAVGAWLGAAWVRFLSEVGSIPVAAGELPRAAGTGALHSGGGQAGVHLEGVAVPELMAALAGACVLAALLAGVWAMSARGGEGVRVVVMILGALGAQVLAALAGAYPFGGRISLGALVLVLCALTCGVDGHPHPWLRQKRWSRRVRVGVASLALAGMSVGWIAHSVHTAREPTQVEELRDVLDELAPLLVGEVVVAEARALPQLGYYQNRGVEVQYVLARERECAPGEARRRIGALRERSGRVWVIGTYSTPEREAAFEELIGALSDSPPVREIERPGARAVLLGGGVGEAPACVAINELPKVLRR